VAILAQVKEEVKVAVDWTGPVDKLEAINLIIRQQGQAEIAALTDIANSVVATKAEKVLAEVSREVQSRELWFNVERDYEITPSVPDGYLLLPSNTVRVDTIIAENAKDLVERGHATLGKRLYDVVNHTYVFTEAVKVKLVVALDFDLLPETAKRYITIRAARQSISQNQVSITGVQLTADDEKRAEQNMLEEDARADDRNQATASPHIMRMRRGQK
jgi:hypothetical protein